MNRQLRIVALLIALVSAWPICHAQQTHTVAFSYDLDGNRINREILFSRMEKTGEASEELLREKNDEYVVSHRIYANPPITKKTLRKYVRQYVGYLTDNNEVVVKIYLNKIDPDDDPSSDILEYFDGGSNHWSIRINLNTGELYDMEVNGDG